MRLSLKFIIKPREKISQFYRGEYATANRILTSICEVNSELALAREMYLKAYDCDGDLDYILSEQMSVEECYRKCLHHII